MGNELIGHTGKERIFAFIIDNLLATILAFMSVALIQSKQSILSGLIFCVVYLAYFLAFEALWSRTPGKFFQRLEVRSLEGEQCDLSAAALRTILRIIEVNPLLFGAIPAAITILSTRRRQRLGDMLAETVVVLTKARATPKARSRAV